MIALEKRFVIGGQNPSDPLFSHPLKSIPRERFEPLEFLKKKKKCKLQSVIITGNDELGSSKVYSIVRTTLLLVYKNTKIPFEYISTIGL